MKEFLSGRVRLYAGDCLERLAEMPACSVDSVVTDPPYGLGFMGKTWDHAENVAFRPALWAQVLRVLKPGGHLVAFSGTRTYHRMACAIEDAGFEVRDMLSWLYGSGFPKSLDVSKAIDKAHGAEPVATGEFKRASIARIDQDGYFASHPEHTKRVAITRPSTEAASEWEGWGTALKPAQEPICFARKPLAEGTVAANVLAHGTGALNIDACRIAGDVPVFAPRNERTVNTFGSGLNGSNRTGSVASGRWPANIVHDGSPEVVAAFPMSDAVVSGGRGTPRKIGVSTDIHGVRSTISHADSGSAARFFYTAKADAEDRIGSKHPTVKPVDLMRWLVRLVTPPKGVVLDPFAGTGTTGAAAFLEGFSAVLIEREDEYRADIARRMALLLAGPEEKKRALTTAASPDDLLLFGGSM